MTQKGLLLSAIEDNDPVIFFEDKTLYNMVGEVPEGYYTIPIGKAEMKKKELGFDDRCHR